MVKHLLVTHHAPDLDAVGAVWMLKRFDAQHYADARIAFTDPGTTIRPEEAEAIGFQMHEVTHVDTGMGEFDHHQTERGHLHICATSLTYDYVCRIHPEYADDPALKFISEFVTDIDHFGEINWPEADSPRYSFMIHELLHGSESVDPHNDDSLMHFGLQCLDCGYAALTEDLEAKALLPTGQEFQLACGKALGIETRNDQVIKIAQRSGYAVVARKDPKTGEMRVKARPGAEIDLKALADRVQTLDHVGTWFYHPSGKMLLNGSRKQRHQRPTNLTLQTMIDLLKELYGEKGQ